jgi:YVTN family beta-propeller protein
LAIAAALTSSVALVGVASAAIGGFSPFGNQQVGQTYANGVLLPTNQWISPLGSRLTLDNSARLVSSTLSPNGQYLAALGWNEFSGFLTIIDVHTGAIVSQTGLDTGSGSAEDFSVGPDGPLFSSDGSTLWVPQSTWLDKFSFDQTTGAVNQKGQIALCGSALTSSACNPNIGPSDASGAYLPAGMALSPDGNTLYVALNGNNTLGVINTQTDTLTKTIPVGNAPRQVVLADNGTVAYVSNEGGRPANRTDFTNLSDGTPIVSSRSTGGAITRHRLGRQPDDRQGDTRDSGRPPANRALPGRQRSVCRQLER